MPMSTGVLKPVLKARIITELQSLHPLTDTPAIQVRDDMAEAIALAVADEVIKHIQNNALVSTNVAVASVGGVTTGPGVSGPGTGTGTGTIS